jgi:hypothetical protein
MQAQFTSAFPPIDEESIDRALALNNRHATELSFQTPDDFRQLVAKAVYARWCPGQHGFLIAFDERADYRNSNFDWFRACYAAFTYIDRVVIDPAHRGQGLARRLYEDLFAQSRASRRSLVVCEVNADPPIRRPTPFTRGWASCRWARRRCPTAARRCGTSAWI